MSKEDKLIPELRFPEFKNEGEWEEKPLEEAAVVNPTTSQLPDEFIYVDLESVENGTLLKSRFIEKQKAPSRAQRLLIDNDVIFQMVRPYQKNNYYFKKSDELDYVASTGYAQLRAFESSMYLYQFIYTDNFVSKVLVKCTGSNYPAINSSDLSEISIQIPKLLEQKKIASCLSSLDEVIAAHTQKLDLLKDHKKGLMQNLFPAPPPSEGAGGRLVPKYRFKQFEKDGDWVEKKLGEMTNKVGSGVTPLGGEANYKKTGRSFVRSQNVSWGVFLLDKIAFIDEPTHQNSINSEIHFEDVLLNITGASIGRSAVANEFVTGGNVNQHVCLIRTYKDFLSPSFLNQFLISDFGQKQIDSFQAGGNRQGLNFVQIRSLSIPIPPSIKEQQKIASCLSSLDALITAQAEKIAQLKLHKKGLMQGLFPKIND